MNIYFVASISQRNLYKDNYRQIIDYLEKCGHTVFGKVILENIPSLQNSTEHKIREWHKEWSLYVQESDLVIVEGSYPSTIHIGFELGMIVSRGKPTILLHKSGKEPKFINNLYSNRLVKSEYSNENVEEVLKWCLEEIERISNRRFTFFISPEIETFLNEISKKTGISRSEYIRELIEKDKNKS